jgi:hypothetical protein
VGIAGCGSANSSGGLISLGYGLSSYIPNSQTKSPITHTNRERARVKPGVVTKASEGLIVDYKLAESEELTKERQLALRDPQAALAERSSATWLTNSIYTAVATLRRRDSMKTT